MERPEPCYFPSPPREGIEGWGDSKFSCFAGTRPAPGYTLTIFIFFRSISPNPSL